MLYSSLALFVLAMVTGLFALVMPTADPTAVLVAQIALVLCLGSSVIVFLVDRLRGANAFARRAAKPSQTQLDLERAEGEGMIASPPRSRRRTRGQLA